MNIAVDRLIITYVLIATSCYEFLFIYSVSMNIILVIGPFLYLGQKAILFCWMYFVQQNSLYLHVILYL